MAFDMGGPTIGVLLEQTLGHISHGRNLRDAWSACDSFGAERQFSQSRRPDERPAHGSHAELHCDPQEHAAPRDADETLRDGQVRAAHGLD